MTLTDLRARLSPFVAAYRRYVGPKRQAALMGLLLGLAQPPFGFLPGLLAYAVLMRSLDGDIGPKPVRSAFLMGWWAGFVYFLIGCFWVAEAFMVDASNQGWMAPFAVCLLPAGIALFWGVAFALYRKLTARFWAGHWSRWFFFAGVLCLFDVLRGTILTGFPWNPIGATWKAGSALSQTAAFIGVYGLGLLTLLIFTSPAMVAKSRGRKGYWPVAASLILLACLFVYGQVRLSTARIVNTSLWVRIVQPDIGQQAKWSEGALLKVMRSYVYLSQMPANGEFAGSVTNRDKKPYPDVVLWPEGALPDAAENLLAPESETALLFNTLLYNRQVLLWGAYHRAIDDNNSLVWRNSLLSLMREGDEITYEVVYSKYKLVPFGEFLPFEEALEKLGVKELAHVGDGFSPGPRTKPVKAGDLPRFLPLICYEGLFPGLSMQSYDVGNQAERPQWIVNISNDAWFGPTTGPVQHLNLSSFRAIEEGLPMVRSTPTGISALIDPLGRIVPGTQIGIHQAGVRDMWLPAPAEATFYTRWRYLHLILVALFCLIPVSIAIFVNVSKNNDTK